jgi:hypothetical protein
MKKRYTRLRVNTTVKQGLKFRQYALFAIPAIAFLLLGGYFFFSNKTDSIASSGLKQNLPPSACYASQVVSYAPAKRKDGSLIPLERRNPSMAIGQPQNNDALNFVSLGFGGEITLMFSQGIANGNGFDLKVTESTFGNLNCNRYPERVQAYASQDGCKFVYLGEACQDAMFDLGALSWAKFIRLKDNSPLNHPFTSEIPDGYDVDGIECLNGTIASEIPTSLIYGSPQTVISYIQGTRKDGGAIHVSRTNPNLALGAPQNDDLGINFTTLGFRGSMVLKFDFVVFNGEGMDLQVVETSFGQQSCSGYPENAYFEGSLDGINWTPMGEVCLDGQLDLGPGIYAIQYIRVTDRTAASSFNNSADGYDIDGISALQPACPTNLNMRTADEEVHSEPSTKRNYTINTFPNPFSNTLEFTLPKMGNDGTAEVKLFNCVGNVVFAKTVSLAGTETQKESIDTENLSSGIYILSVSSESGTGVSRVIKR